MLVAIPGKNYLSIAREEEEDIVNFLLDHKCLLHTARGEKYKVGEGKIIYADGDESSSLVNDVIYPSGHSKGLLIPCNIFFNKNDSLSKIIERAKHAFAITLSLKLTIKLNKGVNTFFSDTASSKTSITKIIRSISSSLRKDMLPRNIMLHLGGIDIYDLKKEVMSHAQNEENTSIEDIWKELPFVELSFMD